MEGKARETLPFGDKKDFEEQQKGFIAPMEDLKIMADAGHVAWDVDRFAFQARRGQHLVASAGETNRE